MKNRYQDVDFCKNPEAICSDERTMEMRWVVALFEWTERVQSYDTNGWNYIEQLNRATQGDLLNDLRFEKSSFIDEVGGILEQGCPYPPCDTVERIQRLNWANARKSSFRVALESLGLPMKSKAFREIESILWRSKDNFEEVVLRSINPTDKKTYQSYRYQFSDFMDALRLVSIYGISFVPSLELPGNFNFAFYASYPFFLLHTIPFVSSHRCPMSVTTINTFTLDKHEMVKWILFRALPILPCSFHRQLFNPFKMMPVMSTIFINLVESFL